MAAILGGIVGALAAAILQYVTNVLYENISTINDHIEEIKGIEVRAIQYWLIDPASDQSAEDESGALLQGAMSASAMFNINGRSLLGCHHDKYIELDQQLFEAATGGDFRGAAKKPDYQRVEEISTICCEIRALLRKCRKAQFGAK
ncbi:hypothetical protein [Phaeobacter inhibens]|uniref:hypothetical protein n=1 Tax=Phaeobacter inhibens TaxID=221822 RepID=UPI0021A494E0|nr:hypothetical protein [Phaeobacter inhibens]UWS06742.1 hypothetical protein K4K98_10775 [Phaeobacter inhibens]